MTDLIAKPFNLTLLALLGMIVLSIFLLWFFLREKSEKTRRNALLILSGLLILSYTINRILIFNDPDLVALWGGKGYMIRETLPFQLCGLGMIFIPLALMTKKEILYAFCFVATPLAALLAIVFPPTPYDVTPFYNPSYFTFYLDHAFCIINGISLVTLGLYSPRMGTIFKTTFFVTFLAFIAHLINLGASLIGLEGVNYFYTLDPEGSGLLELFWSFIPMPYVYLLLYIPVLLTYYFLLVGFVLLIRKFQQGKEPGSLSAAVGQEEA
ncbi:YwaF family protein [Eubacteriaceae bacterium ES2]|nr:YwaF family protein [Eubacteriaceae bacterium ES2]